MPTYEYECLRCGHVFDAFQKITDDPLNRCPKCKGKVKRRIGAGAGILFKGSGFYATDYRSEGYKKAATAEKTPPKKDSDKAPSKKDSEKMPLKKDS
jgi:putative FmdB family regulatory protein